ncbi:hypothetical protein FACS1894125_1790 [Actinomycetota bacterium]|nr:hypothetical protein FACS1894125_1790 [Actinomycetota bacterium]
MDKTLFVEHVLNDPSQVLLFTRPRRMGKTLNLDTLRTFIDPLEKDVAPLFKGLKLEKSPVFDQLGSHPVIWLSFRDFHLESKEFEFQRLVTSLANRYLTKKQISPSLKKLIDEGGPALLSSIRYLCEDIEEATGQKSFIIIDEYDKLYMDSATKGEEAYEEARDFTKTIMASCLKDNRSLFKAAVTGVNRIAQESMFSDLNNIKVYGVFNESEYDTDFGFTEEEVAALIDDKKELEKVRDWYNNYRIGSSKIYFTYSVMSYLDMGRFSNYWGKSGTINLIQSGLTQKRVDQITSAIRGEKFVEIVTDRLNGEDLNGFERNGSFYSLLIQTGYMTFDETDLPNSYELSTPNVELNNVWEEFILDTIFRIANHEVVDAFKHIDKPLCFQAKFKDLLSNKLSYYDFDAKEPEKTYHVYVLALLAAVGIKVKSNKEAGLGRYDLFAFYNNANYVFEFKKAQSEEKLEDACQAAIQQIKDKKYTAEIENNNPTHLVGIGFFGKENLVRVERKSATVL